MKKILGTLNLESVTILVEDFETIYGGVKMRQKGVIFFLGIVVLGFGTFGDRAARAEECIMTGSVMECPNNPCMINGSMFQCQNGVTCQLSSLLTSSSGTLSCSNGTQCTLDTFQGGTSEWFCNNGSMCSFDGTVFYCGGGPVPFNHGRL